MRVRSSREFISAFNTSLQRVILLYHLSSCGQRWLTISIIDRSFSCKRFFSFVTLSIELCHFYDSIKLCDELFRYKVRS